MAQKVRVKNKATGKEFYFTQEQWDKVKTDPQWHNTFLELKPAEKPPEVVALEAKQRKEAEAEAKKEAESAGAAKK